MKFMVARETLGEAVAFVSRALPSRPVVPVLSGMLLDAGPDGLTLSCFDYEVSAKVTVDADVAEPGSALVPGRLLAEITRSLPSRPVEFVAEPGMVNLTCGSAEFGLVCLSEQDYPALPDSPEPVGVIDGGVLSAAIAQVAPAASRDDTLPMLTAVCIDVSGAAMTLVATDRYRMAARELSFEPADVQARSVALVPARIMTEAARMMSAGQPVAIAVDGDQDRRRSGTAGQRRTEDEPVNGSGPGPDRTAGGASPAAGRDSGTVGGMVSFETGGRRLTARLIAGDFIKYRARFPDEFGCRAEIPAAAMIEAVRRAALVTERTGPVRLTFETGQVVIDAHAEGRARAAERVAVDFDGDQPVISFNPQYLLDGLSAAAAMARPASGSGGAASGKSAETGKAEAADADSTRTERREVAEDLGRVRLEFTSPAKPALITCVGDDGLDGEASHASVPAFRYLLVPLRIPVRR